MINDVRRAYVYDTCTRNRDIELPASDPDAGPNKLGKLELCLYGTRDAAKGWQETLSAQLLWCGFTRGDLQSLGVCAHGPRYRYACPR